MLPSYLCYEASKKQNAWQCMGIKFTVLTLLSKQMPNENSYDSFYTLFIVFLTKPLPATFCIPVIRTQYLFIQFKSVKIKSERDGKVFKTGDRLAY